MGLTEKFFKLTPFYNSYKKYKKRQTDAAQKKFEAKHLPLRIQFYKQILKPGDLVFDVGANEGNRVLPFLECGARVIAVEPQPSCIKILTEKFTDKITIEKVGLGDKIGELEMQVASDSTVSSFSKDYINKTKDRFEYSRWENTITVPVTTLDVIIEKYGKPTFCKIDVEGFELQVLKGLTSSIPLLSIEYCVPEMRNELVECLNYYRTLNPEAKFNYSIGESMNWAMGDWKDFHAFSEHVNTREFIATSFGDIYIKSE